MKFSERSFQRLIDNAPVGIYQAGLGGDTYYINDAMAKIFEFASPEEMASESVLERYRNPGDRERLLETLKKEGKVANFEVEIVTRRGRVKHAVLNAILDGERVSGMIVDITELKESERKLRKVQEELEKRVEERTRELVRTQEQLKRTVENLMANRRRFRSLASQHALTEERDRRRFAVYLHDNISQSLGVVKMKLEAFSESKSLPEIVSSLKEINEMVKSTIKNVRSVTVDLSPPVLYELGLEPAIEWVMEQFSKEHGIDCSFIKDGRPKPLDHDLRVLLFQSVRELLMNVAKHAKAQKVVIRSSRKGNRILIAVEDNGIGFRPSKNDAAIVVTSGFGFFSIRERLRTIGGSMEIKSRPGKGSKVTLIAPLKETGKDAKEVNDGY
ncbi:MAG: PAS domain-containing protein [Deltaproteobacteria bacterium]|nr:PAS domain-containing protein [Deltaproteobacteria bacterium]